MDVAKFTIVNIGALSANKFWNEKERARSATSTCTLIEIAGRRLLIDPSPAPEALEPMLFSQTGFRPGEIDMVFVTHFHADHRFGLELFNGKPWLMAKAGLEEWKEHAPDDAEIIGRFLPAEERLPQGVELLMTPGHTRAHCSLRVETKWGLLVAAGDAVMTEDFFAAEEGFRNSVDFDLARATIRRIKAIADLVAPGHGNFFPNWRKVE